MGGRSVSLKIPIARCVLWLLNLFSARGGLFYRDYSSNLANAGDLILHSVYPIC